MASSLSELYAERCNAPKHAYDTCFNAWFKDYLLLVSPPLSAPSDRTKRDKQVEQMKAQYDKNCKGFYDSYQSCLQSAIQTKEGLPEMLEQARREEPLDGWGGIKVATQEDLKP